MKRHQNNGKNVLNKINRSQISRITRVQTRDFGSESDPECIDVNRLG